MTTSIYSKTATQSAIAVNGVDKLLVNETTGIDLLGASLNNVSAVNGGQLAGMRNRIINGDMRVAQRGQVSLTNGVPTYGGCDRTYVATSLFTTATGTVQQEPVAVTITDTKSAQWAAITTSGTGNLVFTQRVESTNCYDLSGRDITVSARVAHNVGSSVNCQILVTAASAVDNFSSETILATGPLIPIPSGLIGGTAIMFSTSLAAFAAANGLAIYVRFTGIGAVTTKWFYVSNLQLEIGPVATPFEHRPHGMEEILCQRYFVAGRTTLWTQVIPAGDTGVYTIPIATGLNMRAAPSLAIFNITSNEGVVYSGYSTPNYVSAAWRCDTAGTAGISFSYTLAAEL